ncbi:MAG: DNA-binding protein [Nanoarchaeota archaeon]|nr:DNA-binding protein [Nanoarchaeota archaeon]MBU1135727.1 DNA-binding protein [Nanoarchaeota archaeon]MBU2520092.1 DNA-binding protein [Nanoarchaeota archaeon]
MDIQDQNELAKARQMEEMKKQMLSVMLTKEAYERLSRVRSVNPQTVAHVEMYLIQLYQAGKFNEQITDAKLKEILQILSEKKDFKITRR